MRQFYSSLLQRLIDWTDEEILLGKKFLDWDEITIHWEDLNLHWEDIFIILESKKGGSGGSPQREELTRYMEGNPWRQLRDKVGEEKAEKIVKVICKINEIEYESILENKGNIRVLVNDFIRSNSDDKIRVEIKF